MKNRLYLYHRNSNIKTLGPGNRYAIWTQGCPHHCKNCIAPATHSFMENGYWIDVDTLFQEIALSIEKDNLRGITISGGEPFIQSEAISALVLKIKQKTNLDIICFSGYTYEELLSKEEENILNILNHIDILIDGKYVDEKNENNYLRGSSNQTIHFLSKRYQKYQEKMSSLKNRNVEYIWLNDTELFVAGIPRRKEKK